MADGPAEPGGREIRVILVDDHAMFRESVAWMLARENDIHVVGTAGSVADGVALAASTQPAVAILDWILPDGDGVAATIGVLDASPATRVLVLGSHPDPHVVVEVVEAGGSSFVTKDRTLAELVDAVRTTAAGGAAIPRGLLGSLLPRVSRSHRRVGADLTRRERHVLRLMADGTDNRELARQLGLSVHTVRNHVQRVLTKLNAHSRLEAVAVAVREGLISRSQSGR